MQSHLLSYDPETERTEIFHWDPATGVAVIETIQRCDDIIAANQDEYAATDEHASWSTFNRVASIPMTLYAQLERSGIAQDSKALKKLLNDGDYVKLRTRPGRL